MSEPIPESIPTSADPRSKRPLKKRALTPRSETASQIEHLFAKPDQEIRLPSTSTSLSKHNGSAPPEIVANVQGSSAGAGSGEFHVYKASRRREYERLRAMDEEVQKEKDESEWERERREREERDREKTRKNREKREKLKKKKQGGKVGGGEGEKAGNANGKIVGGGIKPRVQERGEETNGGEEEMREVQEVGVIIHDDD
ncbi:hypothetical protein B0J14DRAFT_654840 [Halenospora varia]|nr:hypothetical protein B0J14DRAFT_654840 [Halenospora varia]